MYHYTGVVLCKTSINKTGTSSWKHCSIALLVIKTTLGTFKHRNSIRTLSELECWMLTKTNLKSRSIYCLFTFTSVTARAFKLFQVYLDYFVSTFPKVTNFTLKFQSFIFIKITRLSISTSQQRHQFSSDNKKNTYHISAFHKERWQKPSKRCDYIEQ